MFLEKINGPSDVKKLNIAEKKILAGEMRNALLRRCSDCGGHVAPNLGVVELTIALHDVFNSPEDKMIFDVSHQSYCHKMLTGRGNAYLQKTLYHSVTGYSAPEESEHDVFTLGHTATSVGLACGLAKIRDLLGRKENVIAVIGDGSLSGGEAFESLDFLKELNSNLIIVVNDNGMSIAENHGGLYENLKLLRETDGRASCNYFRSLGCDYIFVQNGHDLESLIQAFRCVKDASHPVVVHVCTTKGKGYLPAEQDQEDWHWFPPFDVSSGKRKRPMSGENYDDIACNYLMEKMKKDPAVVTMVAAVPMTIGFTPEKRAEAGKQFIDVGIAEEHAVLMAAGIAKGGGKPVFATHSTFFQRTYDQIEQEVCINKIPVTLLVRNGSVYGPNDVTHIGWFDIPLLSHIPNLVYLAPTNAEEYLAMLDWSIEQKQFPVAIRIPKNGVYHTLKTVDRDYGKLDTYKIMQKGSRVAIIALGDFYQLGEDTASMFSEKTEICPTLINPRYITGIDKNTLHDLINDHEMVITLEDGVLDSGFGGKIAAFYGSESKMKVMTYGLKREFKNIYKTNDILRENHLTPEQIVEDVLRVLDWS